VKFGLFGLHRGQGIAPDVLARRSRAAEDAGFESLWVGDHIALPSGLPGAEEPRLEALAGHADLPKPIAELVSPLRGERTCLRARHRRC
jgi:alkanesulfonate monooxygenase SsuD/methylene tetrahydromethanopterin reductase-like flavin-dependent oxidoreductase (luciferase family)